MFIVSVLSLNPTTFLMRLLIDLLNVVQFHFMKGYNRSMNLLSSLTSFVNLISETPLLWVLLSVTMATLLTFLAAFKKCFSFKAMSKTLSTTFLTTLKQCLEIHSSSSTNPQLTEQPSEGSETPLNPLTEEQEALQVDQQELLNLQQAHQVIALIKEVLNNNEKH